MIPIKNKEAIRKMISAGAALAEIMDSLGSIVREGITTFEIDAYISQSLAKKNMISATKGYMGYKYVSCISINDEVVHGVPSTHRRLQQNDLVKIDICASLKGYCADMARSFYVGTTPSEIALFINAAQQALDVGIAHIKIGDRLSNVSSAIQNEVERNGYGVVRDFAGHGIGKRMHEEPEVLNYGAPGKGPIMRAGMAFAIEPMITMGAYDVYVTEDDWTVKTADGSLAMHVEDTVIVTENGPIIVTRA